jgi:transposase
MWTEEHRKTYRRESGHFPSDLTDPEWARLEPLIPAAEPGGGPRKTNMRAAVNAIVYLLRTGCPQRYLPRDGFPPRPTVYNIFAMARGRRSWAELHMALREHLGRAASPSAAVLDSQSVKSAEKGPVRRRSGLRRCQEGEGPQDPCACSTPKVCRCASSSTPPRSRTATEPRWFSTRYAAAFPGSK